MVCIQEVMKLKEYESHLLRKEKDEKLRDNRFRMLEKLKVKQKENVRNRIF